MIDKKYEVILFAFTNAAFMSGFMSFIITFLNIGFVDTFLQQWLNAYWKAFLVAVPVILIITPKIKNTVNRFIKQ